MESQFVTIFANLGPAAASVVVVWFFLNYLKVSSEHIKQFQIDNMREVDRLFAELESVTKDKGQLIREVNQALNSLDISIQKLIHVIDDLRSENTRIMRDNNQMLRALDADRANRSRMDITDATILDKTEK